MRLDNLVLATRWLLSFWIRIARAGIYSRVIGGGIETHGTVELRTVNVTVSIQEA